MRALATVCAAMMIALTRAAAQGPGPTSAEHLRARLFAFADDSMLGRKAGTAGHMKAMQYIVSQLDLLRGAGISPMGDSARWTQSVPLLNVQLDSAKMRLAGFRKRPIPITYSVDFVPMLGALGFPSAMEGKIGSTAIVNGGHLGSTTAIKPEAVRGAVVLFLPPLRPNGQPDYQLSSYSDLLAQYKNSAAVIVESLDLMPRSLTARIKEPWIELPSQPKREVPLPPVIAMSHAAADLLESDPRQPLELSFAFSMRREATTVPAHNILAMLPGSDTTLSREVVVLSAHSDHLGVANEVLRTSSDSIFNGADASGTGSMALLAIAEALAASPVKPQRSIVFLWTVGGERGELGAIWFSQHPTFKLDRIVAHIDVDMIGDGHAVATNVGCRRDAQRLGGRESAEILLTSASQTAGGGLDDKPQQIDYERYASATQSLAALVVEIANGPRRPNVGGAEPPADCAR